VGRSEDRERRAAEIEWLDVLAAELAAGADPVASLIGVATSASVCPRAVAAARAGADVVAAMRAGAGRSATVRAAAACWAVASGSGAGLAASLVVLADSARENERVRAELEAGLAEPRATAVVLALLPVLGLGLGSVLGAEPLSWLCGTGAGRAVLAAGFVLECLGAWWAWRIATSLEAGL
jgi:tight adherence protein B